MENEWSRGLESGGVAGGQAHVTSPAPLAGKNLSIQIFGALQVRMDGERLELPASRKTRALLVYLILAGGPQRRERLCELLWGLRDDPRGALRWSLSKLRPILNAGGRTRLHTDRERAQLDSQDIAVDFRAACAVEADENASPADLARAWEQTGQLLLKDCELPNQPAYTAWLEDQRQEASQLRSRLSQRLARSPQVPEEEARVWAQRWHHDRPENALPLQQVSAAKLAETSPVSSQTIRFAQACDGASLAWASMGEPGSPPIVKAGNWLTHLEHEWDSPIWTPLYRELARTFRFIRYDERGFGLSDQNVAEHSFETLVGDLETVVEASGVDRFVLMGATHGVPVAIEYAARHPERVSHLILFGGYAAGWRLTSTPEKIREYEALFLLIEAGWGRQESSYRQLFAMGLMPDANGEEWRWFENLQKSASAPGNARRSVEMTSRFDVRHRLGDVKAPALVLHSRGDMIAPLSLGHELAAGLPNAQFRALDSKNHLLLGRESASADFIAAVRDFIART